MEIVSPEGGGGADWVFFFLIYAHKSRTLLPDFPLQLRSLNRYCAGMFFFLILKKHWSF